MTKMENSLTALLSSAQSAHQNNQLDIAENLYINILELDNQHFQSLHNLGILYLAKHNAVLAEQYLQKAYLIEPNDSECLYHLAEVFRLTERWQRAIENYEMAIKQTPNIADYHISLGHTYYCINDYQKAVNAFNHAIKIDSDDVNNYYYLANALTQLRQYHQANIALKHYLNHQPNAHPALNLLANNYLKQNLPFEALHYFNKASGLKPNNIKYQINVIQTLIRLERHSIAKTRLTKLFHQKTLANNQNHKRSLFAKILFYYGICLESEGEFDHALTVQRACWEMSPNHSQALYHMVSNGHYKINDNDIHKAKQQLGQSTLTDETKSHLYFSLATCADKQQRYDDAFRYYQKGNDIKEQTTPFDENRHHQYIKRIATIFNDSFFEKRHSFGLNNDNLIFIVGMPRSGSTLTEQILARHPRIESRGESYAISSLMSSFSKSFKQIATLPECIEQMTEEMSKTLANQYLKLHSIEDNKNSKIIYVDKMLGNFMRLGFIQLLFPKAKIIHCQRNAMDTCLSCYQQNFGHGLRFTQNLKHLGHFYNDYQWLMNHWQNTLSLPIMKLPYENLVKQPKQNITALLDYCQLEVHSDCFNHHQSKQPVGSASFWQSKQPIYQTSVNKHQAYYAYLTPLIEALNNDEI